MPHFRRNPSIRSALALASALVPQAVSAQVAPTSLPTQSPGWHYTFSIYAYAPAIDATSSFPVDSGGTRLNVDAGAILDRLEFLAMGTFGAHNGTWGVFTDAVYFHFGGARSASRDFTIGNVGLPADASASFDWDLKGLAWTLAGEYRVVSDPSFTLDVLAGARVLDIRQHLRWDIAGSIGPLDPLARSGETSGNQRSWDAIVGVKGRYAFGDERRWAIPFYLDVGTGESQSTQQVAAGLAYGFGWGEVTAMWRYLRYNAKSDRVFQDISFSGPLIGATFRW
jgi:hypothetical protein